MNCLVTHTHTDIKQISIRTSCVNSLSFLFPLNICAQRLEYHTHRHKCAFVYNLWLNVKFKRFAIKYHFNIILAVYGHKRHRSHTNRNKARYNFLHINTSKFIFQIDQTLISTSIPSKSLFFSRTGST